MAGEPQEFPGKLISDLEQTVQRLEAQNERLRGLLVFIGAYKASEELRREMNEPEAYLVALTMRRSDADAALAALERKD